MVYLSFKIKAGSNPVIVSEVQSRLKQSTQESGHRHDSYSAFYKILL